MKMIAGYLRRNDNERWEIVGHDGGVYELTSGSVCELQVAGRWIETRIEFDHMIGDRGDYYAIDAGVELRPGGAARIALRCYL